MSTYASGLKTLRLDGLPEDIRRKILDLAAKAKPGGTVTLKQVEYVLDALENGLRLPGKSTKGWEKTNAAIAVGRVALGFFEENPEIKTKFRNHIQKMQASGRVVDRSAQGQGHRSEASG